MDVRQYFKPVDFSVFSQKGNMWKYSLGQKIEKSTAKITVDNVQNLDVAIIGVPFENGIFNEKNAFVPDEIRNELYQLTGFQTKKNIADFGNLREAKTQKAIHLAVRDIVEFFNELTIVTVVLGGSQELSYGICEAFKNRRFFTLSCIDAVLDIKKGIETFDSSNFLSRIIGKQDNLFQFNLIAYQSHLVSPLLFSKLHGFNEHYRLGQLRDDISLAEPVLRNADFLSFDIGAVKYAEAPGTGNINPNGLRSEEACQLARYAGISDKLNVFGMFEVNTSRDVNGITTKLAAQIVWYFLEGIVYREGIESGQKNNRITYRVEVKDLEKPLVFLQCPDTFRWWMEVRSVQGESILIACSEREYRQACEDEIPELWLKYVQKTDEFLK